MKCICVNSACQIFMQFQLNLGESYTNNVAIIINNIMK